MKDHGEARTWKYTPPTKDSVRKQHGKRGGDFDSVVEGPTWSVGAGDHCVRLLPATWPDPEHFGFELMIHYGIGADNQYYLCAFKLKDEPCALCKAGHKPTRRLAYYIIDRKDEAAGPKIWIAGWTINRDITGVMNDDSGEALPVDALKGGYDLNFTRTGTEMDNTKYHSFRFARNPSPITDDGDLYRKWKQYIIEHPINECLIFHPGDYIMKVYNGGAEPKDDDGSPPKTRADRAKPAALPDDDDDVPAPKTKGKNPLDDDEDEPVPPPAKAKKPVPVEDDEEDEPAPPPAKRKAQLPAEAEDEEEEPAPKPAKKKAVVVEEDEPAPPKKGQDKIRAAAAKALDDDEEDEPAPPPKKKQPAPVADEDEDE